MKNNPQDKTGSTRTTRLRRPTRPIRPTAAKRPTHLGYLSTTLKILYILSWL